jgi:hypothetical protein
LLPAFASDHVCLLRIRHSALNEKAVRLLGHHFYDHVARSLDLDGRKHFASKPREPNAANQTMGNPAREPNQTMGARISLPSRAKLCL